MTGLTAFSKMLAPACLLLLAWLPARPVGLAALGGAKYCSERHVRAGLTDARSPVHVKRLANTWRAKV